MVLLGSDGGGGGGAVGGRKRAVYRSLVGKPEGQRSLDKCRRSWKESFKTNFNKAESEDVDWINLAQDLGNFRAVLNGAMKLAVVQTVV